ncbi:MAG: Ig domain-containing protein [Clostridia bacterium]|nr:Ig domain-containing protein [Clostridia bacterium]
MYNRMQNGGSLTDSASGVLSSQGFRALLQEEGLIGGGAYVGYDFYVDDTVPRILSVTLDGNSISVSAEDDRNLAYVAVLSLDGEVKYAESAPGAEAFTGSFDIASAVSEADGYVAVFVGDYAGNEAAVALRVNGGTSAYDPCAVSSVEIMPGLLDLYKGNEADLIAKVSPLTATDRTVCWSASDPSVATVDENGHVTAVGAGSCVITATSNSNTSVSADCQVTVTAVDKTLNGIIWDVDATTCFASFNASDPQNWTVLARRDDGNVIPLNTAFMNGSTLYAATLNVDTEEWETVLYTVDPDNFGLTGLAACFIPATDIAGAPSYNSESMMVYSYGPYLIYGNLQPETEDGEEYSGFVYGYMDASETAIGDAYLSAVAVKSVGISSADYYILDETGKIWQTKMTVESQNTSFSQPSLVVDTGISTLFVWQDLYFDGTYIYWSHTGDETEDWAKLIIIDPSTGAVYDAGDFGERVWPVCGLYVAGQSAPASAEDPSVDIATVGLSPAASRESLMTVDIRDRVKAETEKVKALKESGTAGREGNSCSRNGACINLTGSADIAMNGGSAGASETVRSARTEEIVYAESVAVTNGLVTLTYDPGMLTFAGIAENMTDGIFSCNSETAGEISFAYAAGTALAAGSPIATIMFESPCTDSTVVIAPLELNMNFAVGTVLEETVTGQGHSYGTPEWTWSSDHTRATATFVCVNDASHTVTLDANVVSYVDNNTAQYTATAVFEGFEYSDTVTVTGELTPAFKTNSLTLGGTLIVNFFMDLSMLEEDVREGSYVSFTVSGREYTAYYDPSVMNAARVYYGFGCPIYSIEMNAEITAEYHYIENGVQKTTAPYVGKAVSYIERYQANRMDLGYDEPMDRLVMAIADYGHYIQPFLKNQNGWTYEDYPEMTKYYHDYSEADYTSVKTALNNNFTIPNADTSGTAVAKVAYRLYLDSTTQLAVVVTMGSGHQNETISATVDGNGVTPVSDGSGVYLIYIPNIAGNQLGNKHTVVITTGSGDQITLSNVSAMGYVQRAMAANEDNTVAKNALTSLYYYYHWNMANS